MWGGGGGGGLLSMYAHMESLGPGEVNTVLQAYLGTVEEGEEGVTQTQVEGGGGVDVPAIKHT